NGRGIGTGTVFGRVLADHILGRIAESDLRLPITEPDAPALPAVKEAYYEAGAQIAQAVGGWLCAMNFQCSDAKGTPSMFGRRLGFVSLDARRRNLPHR